ncbi:MAG: hypothetical protein AVDCRST_MAG76-218, partial [uncultured Acidimicrobiales bacterium]
WTWGVGAASTAWRTSASLRSRSSGRPISAISCAARISRSLEHMFAAYSRSSAFVGLFCRA